MIADKKICIVLPAYNAARTLEMTFYEISGHDIDDVILVDDASTDETLQVAKKLGLLRLPTTTTRVTAATRRPATAWRWNAAPTSSSCSTPTISTRPSC